MGQLKSQVKPFDISKWEVKEAWEEVRANKGAPGVDGQSIADFEKDLRNNLYKVWNRMSSGSYFPPPVRAVAIPKPHDGGTRMLGIPAVADRVAQTVVARHLMRRVEPIFHPDSFGYRTGRSALDAVGRCRERCWKRDWVVEFDIAKFFDSVPWDLLVKAVEAHTDAVWVNLYVRRWLAAPLVMPDGSLVERECGTPQGAPVSPVLANLFLHYAFDAWMAREFPTVWFERYADDAVLHCVTERQAREVLAALTDRMVEVGLRLHPDKTRIVYCKNGSRHGSFEHEAFTFLGYTFRARRNRTRHGRLFLSFEPAVSQDALKRIGREVRSWQLHTRSDLSFDELARWVNPMVAGWINYFGRFRPWELHPFLMRINAYLVRWIRQKYKRLKAKRKAVAKLREIAQRYPPGCSRTGASPWMPRWSDDQGDKSRVTGDCYARFCESRGVRSPSATRHDTFPASHLALFGSRSETMSRETAVLSRKGWRPGMMLIMPSLVAPAIPVGAFAASDQPTLPIGSRVLLRPWRLADAEAVTEAFQNPEIQRWHVRRADSVEEARKWIEDWQSSWRSETGGHWAVAGAEGDELLGRVSLKSLHLEDGKAEVAYWMAPAARLYPCSNVAVALGP